MGIGVHRQIEADLLEVALAGGGPRLGPGLIQGRQQHGGKNGDDRDHNQQLDQREAMNPFHFFLPPRICKTGFSRYCISITDIIYYESQFQKDWLFPVNNSFSHVPSPS